MDSSIELQRVLEQMLGSVKFHQTLLHEVINKNNEHASELNEIWIAIDKMELALRRILQ
jgi:hypothetical protein